MNSAKREVWITGLGMLCGLGQGARTCFDAALAGRSGVQPAPESLAAGMPNLLIAPCPINGDEALDKAYRGMDRATQLAVLAAQEAVAQSRFDEQALPDAERVGVYAGVGLGGAQTLDAMYSRYFTALQAGGARARGATVMHPLSVPRLMANSSAAALSMRYGLRGMSLTYSVACSSSAIAAGEALRAIENGYLDAAIVVGTEAMLTTGALVGWNALRVMAHPDSQDASRSCKPFSRNRSGFVLGEGACAMVLETRERAERRDAKPLAHLAGYGASSDAAHLTAPNTEGQLAAMRQALAHAGLQADQLGYINAHGTATEAGDVIECESLRILLGDAAARVPVSSTKAVHGHLIGAGGTLELGMALMALNSGSLPPTMHLDEPDPRCDLDLVPNQARHGVALDAVMSNSFAFGGSNAVLVARKVAA